MWSQRLTAVIRFKSLRYLLVSVVAVAVSQATLALTFGVLRWSAVVSNIVAAGVATVPTYVLSRSWVWGRHGRSHLLREVLPFGVLSVLGLVLSSLAASGAEHLARAVSDRRAVQTVIVMAGTLFAFGVLWLMRFLILDKLLFPPVLEPAPPEARADMTSRDGWRVTERVPATTASAVEPTGEDGSVRTGRHGLRRRVPQVAGIELDE